MKRVCTPTDPLRYHGDDAARDAVLDFAVNVQGKHPPQQLQQALQEELTTLGSYPSGQRLAQTTAAVAEWLGVPAQNVLLVSGASEAFALLPRVFAGVVGQTATATMIHPGFTEPEVCFREQGMAVEHRVLAPPFTGLTQALSDGVRRGLVMVGNPTNPTGVLFPPEQLLSIDCSMLVVDEAFIDVTGHADTHSLLDAAIGQGSWNNGPDEVVVIRSLTKTWALAGLRCGVVIASPAVIEHMRALQPHWPLSSLQLRAFEWVSARPQSETLPKTIAANRDYLVQALQPYFSLVVQSQAPYVLMRSDNAPQYFRALAERAVAVRRCDTFPGLDDTYLRFAVKEPALVDELVSHLQACAPANTGPGEEATATAQDCVAQDDTA